MHKISVAALAICIPFGLAFAETAQSHTDNAVEWEILSAKLCIIADMYYGYNEAGEKVEDVFLNHLGIGRETPDHKDQIFSFWNANSDKLHCKNPSAKKPHARSPQHFMKRVVDLNMENQIFYEFLLADSELQEVDVNAVEFIDGRGETLLDYLNDILADPSREVHYDYDEIAEFREYIVEEYGAKTAAQLAAAK